MDPGDINGRKIRNEELQNVYFSRTILKELMNIIGQESHLHCSRSAATLVKPNGMK